MILRKKKLTIITTAILSISILGTAYAYPATVDGYLRGAHYYSGLLNTRACGSSYYMNGASTVISNHQQIYTTSPLQATAGVELWKDGYYIDAHSNTVNGSGKVEANDLLDACFHPSNYDYDLYVSQNVWFPDATVNNIYGAYKSSHLANW